MREKHLRTAVLTARVIDRPMRPLFPKDYRNDVTLNNLVMSCRSGMPSGAACYAWVLRLQPAFLIFRLTDRCATTQVGMVDGEFVVNPSQAQWDNG